MRYIEAFSTEHENWYYRKAYDISLFLAGGISNCPNWQEEVCRRLDPIGSSFSTSNLVVLNPRRKTFDSDKSASKQQIEWEFHHLNATDTILFWFPCETLCPITLFEYGKWLISEKPLFVGCHPDYARKEDLLVQTRLERPDQKIHFDLPDLIADIEDSFFF